MQKNSIRIDFDFGWKSFLHFLALRPQVPTYEKILKKIYFANPQILCSIATAGPENAKEQHSNRFWLKKFHSIFWLRGAQARTWKCKKFESILFEKVSLHVDLRPQARTCEKILKKYILKIHKFYVQLQKQTLKMQTNSIRIDFGW